MGLELAIQARAGKGYVPYLRRMIPRAAELARSPVLRLSVALVGDRAMARLHGRFLNIAKPTDVLTFELDHGPRGRCIEGEVVLNVAQARRINPHRVREELLLYALHGLLHLSGEDDHGKKGYARMHQREDRILTQLSVGKVFILD